MLKLILPLIISSITSISFSQQFEWAVTSGGTNTEHTSTLVTDPTDGSVYITGFFFDDFDADPGASTTNMTSAGLMDVFLVKLDAQGNYLWSNQIGGTAMDNGIDLVIDSQQNIIVLVDSDPTVELYKYDSGGALLWSYSSDLSLGLLPFSTVVDNNDDIYICGVFSDSVDFDNTAATDYKYAPGIEAGFLTKLTSNGQYLWAKVFGGPAGGAICQSLAASETEDIYVAGFFHGPVDFDPGIGSEIFSAFGSTDIFTLKLDTAGTFTWLAQTGGTDSNQSRDIKVDSDGNTYLTGFFDGSIDADPSVSGSHNLFAVGSADFFAQKLDQDGNLIWASSFGGTGYDIPEGIVVDSDGYSYLTGNFGSTADFDPSIDVYDLDAGLIDESFILKLDPLGGYVWAHQVVANDFNTGYDITLDQSNNVLVTGGFSNQTDMDPTAGTDQHTSISGTDIYVIKLSQPTVAGIEVEKTSTTLYPNPSKGQIFFSNTQEGTYHLYGTDGRLVQSGVISGSMLSFIGLPSGVYNLQISGSKDSISKRIIID